VVVFLIKLTTTSWLTRERPRQFWVMWENRRCSILFHLLVPGGKRPTLTQPSFLPYIIDPIGNRFALLPEWIVLLLTG
jgi:hypothetical protein